MNKPVKNPLWKRLLTDTLGVLMLIAVPFVGWIPGPGGIPLLLGGLTLLSLNHDWAKRWLEEVKTKGTSVYELLFPQSRFWNIAYDVIGVLFIVGSVLAINKITRGGLLESVAFMTVAFGGGLLLANRKRIERILAFAKKLYRKRT